MVISAIILSEMSVHRKVIGHIACDAASVRQSSIIRRNQALKVALSSEYEQISRWQITKEFHCKVISVISEMRVHVRVIGQIAYEAAS